MKQLNFSFLNFFILLINIAIVQSSRYITEQRVTQETSETVVSLIPYDFVLEFSSSHSKKELEKIIEKNLLSTVHDHLFATFEELSGDNPCKELSLDYIHVSSARRLQQSNEYYVFNSYWYGNVTFDTTESPVRLNRVWRWERLAFRSSRFKLFQELMNDMLFSKAQQGNIINSYVVFDTEAPTAAPLPIKNEENGEIKTSLNEVEDVEETNASQEEIDEPKIEAGTKLVNDEKEVFSQSETEREETDEKKNTETNLEKDEEKEAVSSIEENEELKSIFDINEEEKKVTETSISNETEDKDDTTTLKSEEIGEDEKNEKNKETTTSTQAEDGTTTTNSIEMEEEKEKLENKNVNDAKNSTSVKEITSINIPHNKAWEVNRTQSVSRVKTATAQNNEPKKNKLILSTSILFSIVCAVLLGTFAYVVHRRRKQRQKFMKEIEVIRSQNELTFSEEEEDTSVKRQCAKSSHNVSIVGENFEQIETVVL